MEIPTETDIVATNETVMTEVATATIDDGPCSLQFVKHSACSGSMTFGNARSLVAVDISPVCFHDDEEMKRSAPVFRRLLAGERNLSATMANYNQKVDDFSTVFIHDDTFQLSGGAPGPTYGGGGSPLPSLTLKTRLPLMRFLLLCLKTLLRPVSNR
jgi:hypothetical protein